MFHTTVIFVTSGYEDKSGNNAILAENSKKNWFPNCETILTVENSIGLISIFNPAIWNTAMTINKGMKLYNKDFSAFWNWRICLMMEIPESQVAEENDGLLSKLMNLRNWFVNIGTDQEESFNITIWRYFYIRQKIG